MHGYAFLTLLNLIVEDLWNLHKLFKLVSCQNVAYNFLYNS